MTIDSTWIRFREVPASGKTQRWVVEMLTGVSLGHVAWFGAWRQYAFYPDEHTVLERQCLRNIAEFCELRTREYRAVPKLTTAQKVGG